MGPPGQVATSIVRKGGRWRAELAGDVGDHWRGRRLLRRQRAARIAQIKQDQRKPAPIGVAAPKHHLRQIVGADGVEAREFALVDGRLQLARPEFVAQQPPSALLGPPDPGQPMLTHSRNGV